MQGSFPKAALLHRFQNQFFNDSLPMVERSGQSGKHPVNPAGARLSLTLAATLNYASAAHRPELPPRRLLGKEYQGLWVGRGKICGLEKSAKG